MAKERTMRKERIVAINAECWAADDTAVELPYRFKFIHRNADGSYRPSGNCFYCKRMGRIEDCDMAKCEGRVYDE